MNYPTTQFTVINRCSYWATTHSHGGSPSIKAVQRRLVQRILQATLGTAAVATLATPVRAEMQMASLSFELDSRSGQEARGISSHGPLGSNLEHSTLEHSTLEHNPKTLPLYGASHGSNPQTTWHMAELAQTISLIDQNVEHQNAGQLTASAWAIANPSAPIPDQWWQQGSASPIAVAIGHAEGTRQANGSKNSAYYWHQDPGNGADNFGTFSYQHFSATRTREVRAQGAGQEKRELAAALNLPEIADQQQMQRLRGFYQQLQHQAEAQGIVLSLLEIFNGLDLINQSEAAGLSKGGYIDRLIAMRGLEEDVAEQIQEARSWAYWHPERQTWDAPGLGNSYLTIRQDQARRFEAVKRAMETYIYKQSSLTFVAQNRMTQPPVDIGAQPQGLVNQPGASQPQKLEAVAAQLTQATVLNFSLGHAVAVTHHPQDSQEREN